MNILSKIWNKLMIWAEFITEYRRKQKYHAYY